MASMSGIKPNEGFNKVKNNKNGFKNTKRNSKAMGSATKLTSHKRGKI